MVSGCKESQSWEEQRNVREVRVVEVLRSETYKPRQVNQEVPENPRFTFSPNPLQDDDQYRDGISLPDSTHGTREVGAESPGQRSY